MQSQHTSRQAHTLTAHSSCLVQTNQTRLLLSHHTHVTQSAGMNDVDSFWAAEEAAWVQADSALTPGIWLDAALDDHAWHDVEIASELTPEGKHQVRVPRNADLVRRLRIDMVHDTPIVHWSIGGNIVGDCAVFMHAAIPLRLLRDHTVKVTTTAPFILRYEATVVSTTACVRADLLFVTRTHLIVPSLAAAGVGVAEVAEDMPRPPLRVRDGCMYTSVQLIPHSA